MRTVIVCLTLILASWGVAAEQAKHPKKIIKTAVAKPVPVIPKGKSAANHGISRKGIKPAASKPTLSHMAAQKSNASKVKKTSALKRTSDRVAAEQADGHKNITVAVVKPAAKPERPAPPKSPPANELFGSVTIPAALASRSIGFYTRGCLAGGVALPMTGENWQVMRPSRNRYWANPRLIDYLEQFARDARTLDGWPGLLIGDISQPRGGPMLSGHSSHQMGLDVDVWLTPMPDHTLTFEERETTIAESMLKDPFTVDPEKWTPLHTKLIKRAASYPEVDRIFVHPAIKKVLCEQAGEDRAWLAKVRPWWNHYYHFHVRLSCPLGAGQCKGQKPAGPDDGCGQELANWYVKLKKAAIATANNPPSTGTPAKRKGGFTMAALPAECSTVLTAGGFEAVPRSSDVMSAAALNALASKEAGPPLPRLDAAALRALIELSDAKMPLPDRNPNR
jgi:penicillin-insensitive murein endopeptidase